MSESINMIKLIVCLRNIIKFNTEKGLKERWKTDSRENLIGRNGERGKEGRGNPY